MKVCVKVCVAQVSRTVCVAALCEHDNMFRFVLVLYQFVEFCLYSMSSVLLSCHPNIGTYTHCLYMDIMLNITTHPPKILGITVWMF